LVFLAPACWRLDARRVVGLLDGRSLLDGSFALAKVSVIEIFQRGRFVVLPLFSQLMKATC
jgi:hypothetical protein